MRRAVLTLGGTAAGIAALLSFKTHAAATGLSAEGSAAGASSSGAGAAGTGGSGDAAGATPAAKQSGAASPAPQTTRTVTGNVANTKWGPMQIQLVLTGQRITKVNVLQRTNSGQESDEIDSSSIPQLIKETLAAQSARIAAVSGASYTSSGYLQSLQSAVDKATA